MTKTTSTLLSGLFALAIICMFSVSAEAFTVHVQDDKGDGVKDIVVKVEKVAGGPYSRKASSASVTQQDLLFKPYVTVVQAGSAVNFPNKDETRHHVYSFSTAKKFQLPLFLGKSKDVIFDKPGIVVLGCNIHDWMLAYVIVTDTPYYGVSRSNGKVDVGTLEAGEYSISYWYPGLDANTGFIKVGGTVTAEQQSYQIVVPKGAVKRRPKARDDGGDY